MSLRDYKLAVFDMDGVLTQPISSWGYVHQRLGLDNTIYSNSYRAGNLSYIDFLKSDVNLWLRKLGPTKADVIIRILKDIPLRDGVLETIEKMKTAGLKTVIISGGIYWLAEAIGKEFGFDEIFANQIKMDRSDFIVPDGVVMVDPKHKDVVMRELQKKLGISQKETISVGDTSQDIAMFRNSGLSFAFNPVETSVSVNASFTVTGNDLSAILDHI